MSGIKITPADSAFSRCVRERADWSCERCGGRPSAGGLHCSHFHGRGKWSVRFEPMNGTSLCMGCHLYLSAHPSEHLAFQLERIGAYAMGVLQEMAGDIARGRAAKRESKAIAAHYRSEHRKMVARKVAGESGKVDFIGYF